MRVGILTFHRALNNGAVLQALALEKAIEKIGANVEIVDYASPKIENDYSLIRINNGFKSFLISCKLFRQILLQKKNFRHFLSEKMSISACKYSTSDIQTANERYDKFITGSDQVWSPTCAGFDTNYFLTFAEPKKKYSYAASLGQDVLPEVLLPQYKERLNGFNVLSCREKSAIGALSEVYGGHIHCHIDPVFLLNRNEWNRYVEKPLISEPYIFIFRVHVPNYLFKFAEHLNKATGIKLVYSDGKRIYHNNLAQYIPGLAPNIFLNLIANAEYVITNSFHGVAFSLIFHKNLYVELNNTGIRNSRAELLLRQLEAPYHEIINETEAKEIKAKDWTDVDQLIQIEVNLSMNYLKGIIAEN